MDNLSIQRRSDASIQLDVDQFRRSLAAMGTDLYFGGPFSQTADGAVKNLKNIARFNTSANTWAALPHNGLNEDVLALAALGTYLYVGGTDIGATHDGAVTELYKIA